MYDDCPEEKKKTIDASVILNEIRNGKAVIHDCVIVKGDLELQPLTHINTSITIINSIIKGKVCFENIVFINSLDFRGTTFQGEVKFKGSTFCQPSEFEGVHFEEATYFGAFVDSAHNRNTHTHFIGSANFKKSVFEKYVDFNNAIFDGSAEFSRQNRLESFNNRSIFKGHTIFIGTCFKGIAHFEACEFLDVQYGVEFRYARFIKEACFQGASFSGYANFMNTTFKEYTDFNNTKFTSQTNGVGFAEAIFSGYVTDFRHVLFNGIFANFRATKFTGEFVSFRNAKFRNITDQERACRKAKKQLNNSGNRSEEDYMFFAEMEARRRQKGITKTPYPESPKRVEWGAMSLFEFIDYFKNALHKHEWSKISGFFVYNLLSNFILRHLFGGYGIFWHWIAVWWLFISILFGIYYWIYQGIVGAPCFWQCIYFSFLVAFTRGYGSFSPRSGFGIYVTIETIFGLFMFGVFIASITRKYMR
jgi:uncharacterized protein YjbI with pentapeptide repeats